jgi:ribosome maturation factor RimP
VESIQAQIESRLAESEPEVEVIALEQPGRESLRLYIDHPDGVDLALCETVTNHLRDLLTDYSLEVSSPGLDRPLTKPEHYRRFRGHRVRVRTRDEIEGRRNFTGTIADAGDESIRVEDSGDAYEIPLSSVHRSNLVPELPEVHS